MALSTPSRVRPGFVLLLTSGATFIAYFDVTVVNVAFPALHRDFPATPVGTLSWVVSSYSVFFAALLTPAGRLADVIGRRRLFLLAVAGFTVASALSCLAPNVAVLIAARSLQGLCAGSMLPSALALVLAATPPERRTIAAGIWGASGAMAAAAGPALGGLLVDLTSWRWIFLINVPIGMVLVAAGWNRLPRDEERGGRRLPDLIGAIVAAAGVGSVVVALSKAETWEWSSVPTIGALSGGALLLAYALMRSLSHPAPAIETGLWRDRTFATANITSMLGDCALFALLLSGPLFLTGVWGYSILEAGLAVTPGAFSSAVASVLVGRWAVSKHRRTIAVSGGSLLFAASNLWLWSQIGSEPRFLLLWLPTGLLNGIAVGAVITGLSSVVATSVAPASFAAGTGLNSAAGQLGGAIGVATMATILTVGGLTADGFRAVFLFCAVVAFTAACAALGLSRRSPNSLRPAEPGR